MFQNKNANRILSLIIAIILWGYVIVDINPTVEQRFENVPVKIQNQETLLQRGLALADSEYTTTVVISGKRSDIAKISAEDISASMDVYGYALGTNYIPVKIDLPDDLAVASNMSSKLEVIIEEYVSSNREIEVLFTGDLEEGVEPGDVNINPQQIEVRGARSRVESVKRLVAEVPVASIANSGTASVAIQPLDEAGNYVDSIELSATTATVSASLLNGKKVRVSLAVEGEISEDYEVESIEIPQEAYITGDIKELEKIDVLTATAIDISGVKSTTAIPLEFSLPEGIKLSGNYPAPELVITIKGNSTSSVNVQTSEIIFDGLGAELSAYVNTSTVEIIMTGDKEVLDQVKVPGDFRLSVDLSGLTAGTYTVPIMAKYNLALKEVTISPIEVQVTINAINEAF